MEQLFLKAQTKQGPSNRVTVFIVSNRAKVRKVTGMKDSSAPGRRSRWSHGAMMPVMIESTAGVTREEALELLPEARKVAALHPNDATVLAALAEAEFDAGNDHAAIAATDRAVAIDPKNINAHIQKGYALAHQVHSGALPKESWKDVRSQFIKAHSIDHDNPI